MKEAGKWIYLEGWLPFILIVLFLAGGIVIMARYLNRTILYSICGILGAAGIGSFLYSYLHLGGTNEGAGTAFYSVAFIIGVSIGTAITPFIKKKESFRK
jgi:membrane protease YdiL (CAAX protease family)